MSDTNDFSADRRQFVRMAGIGAVAGAGILASAKASTAHGKEKHGAVPTPAAADGSFVGGTVKEGLVVADPTKLPAPITYKTPRSHDVELVVKRVKSEILPGVTHTFMTFNGQIPGPMIRARQGDTLRITVTNPAENVESHSIDLHAVYGTGGGGEFTEVAAGESKTFTFKALYAGAFIYHCGVANMDEHISRGMFGMIVIEPEEGLPKVDREIYLGQHELYTKEGFGQKGEANFSGRNMVKEDPTYVMFNGAVAPFVNGRFGTIKANVGETVRVFLVTGGPNKTSSFHPVGNVWSKAWPQGGLANPPLNFIQTWPSSPGSAFVGDMHLPVPQLVTLVDHSLSRVTSKGNAAQIEVIGDPQPDILKTEG
ncbi:nitrite reductase, copper-containing [Pseudovibrio japonicus]|uniref:Copper-containing nitrite reductase n=1 Tax=Pseudovibrio japonicus TaxID=366534 RepID=A0ABQ3EHQ1_9HYPH|nr:copper-containing nitrite reductase [Pseudovibrio japonicus]GHB39843.1 nitrite reductase, copper-containing [Pseudovibrio japonicus]